MSMDGAEAAASRRLPNAPRSGVMAAHVAAIHGLLAKGGVTPKPASKTWMPGTSPGMTERREADGQKSSGGEAVSNTGEQIFDDERAFGCVEQRKRRVTRKRRRRTPQPCICLLSRAECR